MALILNIEASADACTVALSNGKDLLFCKENFEERSPAKVLAPFVEEALKFADTKGLSLEAVALSSGPGSYTGLRIASSTAKGICYGRDIPLIAVSTTAIMSSAVATNHSLDEGCLLCPMIDARRNEVYTALYDKSMNRIMKDCAMIVENDCFREHLDKNTIYFFGSGAGKCRDIIKHPNTRFIDGYDTPLASSMQPLSEESFLKQEFADIAYFEPSYLKDFIATKPKKLL